MYTLKLLVVALSLTSSMAYALETSSNESKKINHLAMEFFIQLQNQYARNTRVAAILHSCNLNSIGNKLIPSPNDVSEMLIEWYYSNYKEKDSYTPEAVVNAIQIAIHNQTYFKHGFSAGLKLMREDDFKTTCNIAMRTANEILEEQTKRP